MPGVVGAMRAALAAVPRECAATTPTPLTSMHLDFDGPRVWVKRDDLIGPGMGGNKVRKLEFLLADALAAGADCLVTVGAAQSNHARLTAALAATRGLETHLVLGGDRPPRPEGNQLLATLFGATLHYPGTDDWDELTCAQEALAVDLRRSRSPYVIPIGGSTPVGALGFVAAYDELVDQCDRLGVNPSAIVHATSSGGTHAGLLVGEACYRADGRSAPDILAVSVAKSAVDLTEHAGRIATGVISRLGLDDRVAVDTSRITVDGRWKGSEYARPTTESSRAISLAARRDAIVLDPVYTGKAFAGLLGQIAEHRWPTDSDVVFWHTGGQPALFASPAMSEPT